MPCVGGGPSDNENPRILNAKINKLTRLLCDACRRVSNEEALSSELAEWYVVHMAEDEERRDRALAEIAEGRDVQAKKQHLAGVRERLVRQLDADEREAVGL